MAAKRVFITGATGYVGGSVLRKLVEVFPDWEVTALMRGANAAFEAHYPAIKTVQGTFDDADVIERASRDADIIIHTGDTDNESCARAVLAGAAKRRDLDGGRETFVVHLTGTGCIADLATNPWKGQANPRVWDDVADADEIYNLAPPVIHRPVDRWFQEASDGDKVKVVCIAPPDIYGPNAAVGSSRNSFLVPMYVKALLDHGTAFYLGEGQNLRAVTHIDDTVSLFILILQKYLDGSPELAYGKEGFYFGVVDEIPWKQAAEAVLKIGQEQGWLGADTQTASWTKEQLEALTPWRPIVALYLWGSNSRAASTRAKKLGWKPSAPSFWDVLPADCKASADLCLAKRKEKEAKGEERI